MQPAEHSGTSLAVAACLWLKQVRSCIKEAMEDRQVHKHAPNLQCTQKKCIQLVPAVDDMSQMCHVRTHADRACSKLCPQLRGTPEVGGTKPSIGLLVQ